MAQLKNTIIEGCLEIRPTNVDGIALKLPEGSKIELGGQEFPSGGGGISASDPNFTDAISMGRLENSPKGFNSVALGVDSAAQTEGSIALGKQNVAGAMGYYIRGIERYAETACDIYLSTKQVQNAPPIDSRAYSGSMEEGVKLDGESNIVTGKDWSLESQIRNKEIYIITPNNHYVFCGTIYALEFDRINVDNLHLINEGTSTEDFIFNTEDLINYWNSMGVNTQGASTFQELKDIGLIGDKDYMVCIPSYPQWGACEVTISAFAEGRNSYASTDYSHAEGRDTVVGGAYGHTEGRKTIAGYAAHAEGYNSKAKGRYSHAEGEASKATGHSAHAEGQSIARGAKSHAEGVSSANGSCAHSENNSIANGNYSHTEGTGTTSGEYSHAEGIGSNATNVASHAEGYVSTAAGHSSHSEGYNTQAKGNYSHAEGNYTQANGANSHAEGRETIAGDSSHAEGWKAQATGSCSHAEGEGTTASGLRSHSEGYNTQATGENAHAEGYNTKAIGQHSHAEGHTTEAKYCGHAEGGNTKAHGNYSHAEGNNTQASASSSHAEGEGTKASSAYQHVQGKYNLPDSNNTYAHITGWGTSSSPSNIHTLKGASGDAWFKGSVTSNGADYAEYFEWLDGNTENEDRVGLIVALDGEKIKLANSNDEILGIISGTAAILGDNYECEWNGKYLTDDFGRIQYEEVEEFHDVVVGIDEETNEPIIEKQSLGFFKRPVLNPHYDPEQEYINRANRPEWDTVGMLGKLYVRDDGTCIPNFYATIGTNGIATSSLDKTNMRVLSRVNDSIVRVLLK